MTHTTESLVNVALASLILVNIVAAVAIFKKVFGRPWGFRRQDRFYSLLDDVNERLAVIEMTIEEIKPKNSSADHLDRQTEKINEDLVSYPKIFYWDGDVIIIHTGKTYAYTFKWTEGKLSEKTKDYKPGDRKDGGFTIDRTKGY
jgi:hypothetical protein